MAMASQTFRMCLRGCSMAARPAAPLAARPAARAISVTTSTTTNRLFSTTQIRRDDEEEEGDAANEDMEKWEVDQEANEAISERLFGRSITEGLRDLLPEADREKVKLPTGKQALEEQRFLSEARATFAKGSYSFPFRRNLFWGEGEEDPEMITDEVGEDEFMGDDITSMAHGKLDELRERRHYFRVAAWEMPLLSKLAKKFTPPTADMPLRFRYTSYMGESHPAEKKVVVEFCPSDLDLTEVQQNKLKKLAGSRYNPETEIVRMSCESFEHQAQNKRYLGDLVQKLIAEAKTKDTFEDIPLDTRHHTFKSKPHFPKEWRMTDARRKELQDIRTQVFLLEQKKATEGLIVDGAKRVQEVLAAQRAEGALQAPEKVAEVVRR